MALVFILTIVFGGLILALLIALCINSQVFVKKYRKELKAFEEECGKNYYKCQAEHNDLRYDLRNSESRSWKLIICIAVIIGMILVMYFCFGIEQLGVKKEVAEFEETRKIYSTAIKNGSLENNTAITIKIVEANEWLAKCRADKRIWGCASRYYFLDPDKIKPIG